MSFLINGDFRLRMRHACPVGPCPPEGHCAEGPFELLDAAVAYALEVAETDSDWLPLTIECEGDVLWEADLTWNRQAVIVSLRTISDNL